MVKFVEVLNDVEVPTEEYWVPPANRERRKGKVRDMRRELRCRAMLSESVDGDLGHDLPEVEL